MSIHILEREPSTNGEPSQEELELMFLANGLYAPHSAEDLPDYDSEVLEIEADPDPDHSYECKNGSVEALIAVMDDNTHYPIRFCVPNELLSNTLLTEGTAWWTHPDLEHYKKGIRSALKLGYTKAVFGPPSGVRAKDVSPSKALYDQQRILDVLLASNPHLNPDEVIAGGDSRGAILALGSAVTKYAGNRKTPYIDVTAPPAPRPFSDEELPHVVAHLFTELMYVRRTAWEALKNGELQNYAKTLMPWDLSHASNSARMLPSFINGEAGVITDNMDKSSAIYVVECLKDYWALIGEYEKKFADRENVQHEYIDAYHIEGIARSNTRRDRHARLERLRDIRGFDGSFDNIDYVNDVFTARHRPRPASGNKALGVILPFIARPKLRIPRFGKVA